MLQQNYALQYILTCVIKDSSIIFIYKYLAVILSIEYTRFNAADKQMLRQLILGRWLAAIKRLWKSLLLPFGAAGTLGWLINLVINTIQGDKSWQYCLYQPKWTPGISALFIVLVSLSFFMLIANVIMFIATMVPIYYDRLRGRKQVIYFKPEPYYLQGDDDYYIKTGIPEHPFLKVNFEAYSRAKKTEQLVMEMTPSTNIILNIGTGREQGDWMQPSGKDIMLRNTGSKF